MSLLIALCFLLSLVTSLMLVASVRTLALQWGFVDQPDRDRKLHRQPIALCGGVAVFAALVISLLAVIQIDRRFGMYELGVIQSNWYVLFFAAGAILLVGLVDDAFSLRGRQKLLLQFLIIAALVGSGTVVEIISVFGKELHLGVFAYPITVLWLLIAVNALNLIDGADGMATTVGCFVSAGLALLAWQTGSTLGAVVAISLSGALVGFLFFNRPPASIFLGDAGSMMIGLFVGVLAVWSSVKESTVLASAPVAILALPLFDSSAAILRRWLTGRSIYATDRAHLHHLLQEKFGSRGMLLVVAGLCAVTTFLAVFSSYYGIPWLAGVGVIAALAILVFTRSFGHAEARLVLGKMAAFTNSFLASSPGGVMAKQHHRLSLQGSGRWETIWEPLVEFAKSHDLAKVKIDLSLAWLHEGYHATWNSVQMPERAFQMCVRLPLFTHQTRDGAPICIGRLEIIAAANDPTVYERIADLSEKLVDLGPQIDLIIADLETRHQKSKQVVAVADRDVNSDQLVNKSVSVPNAS
tara:strand:- start:276125 stop:277699 length:1575 start_codon:yes stop_codon:yes gene_type:complete